MEVVDISSSTNAASPVIMGNSSGLIFSNVSLMWPAALCGEIVSGDISSPCHDQSLFSRVSTTLGTIKLQDTSQIFITASLFSGFHNFSGVTIINATNTSRLKLGCNLWNRAPLNITVVEATIPPRMIDYPKNSNSSFQDSSTNRTVFTCNAYIEPPAPFTQAPTTLGDQLGGAAAPFFASAGVGAAVISGNVGALGDLQVLFAASSSVCAPSGLRSMGKSSSFLLSPFTSLNGEAYQVIGNLGILACIVALHAGAVAVVTWRRRNSFADTVKLEKRSQPSQRDGQTIPASSSSLLPPEAVLQFPNLSFVAALLLAPGVVRTIPLLISASGEGSSVALQLTVGVIAIVALSVGVYWRAWLVVSTPLFSRLRFVPYRRSELDSVRLFNGSTSPVPRLLLPTGRWEPEIARRCYGRLRGAVHGGAVRWSMFRPCYQLLLCVLTGVPVPLSWCTGYWIVLCTVQAAVAVFVVVERPSRARFTDILLA
ncbi:transmembrane protein, putative, partial [Bodo saltans]